MQSKDSEAQRVASQFILNFWPDVRTIDPAIRRVYGDEVADALPVEIEKLRKMIEVMGTTPEAPAATPGKASVTHITTVRANAR